MRRSWSVFPVVIIAILLAGIALVLLNIGKVQIFPNKAADNGIDTLDYFISKHAAGVSNSPKSLSGNINFSQTISGNSSFYVKYNNPGFYEYHTWDDNYIYLIQDTTVGTPTINGQTATSYRFAPGYWMKRHMQVGEILPNPGNQLTWFNDSCQQVGGWTHPYAMVLESHDPGYNAGGALGIQDVIVLRYDYGATAEKFYYSREWGWFKWEEWDNQKHIVRQTAEANGLDNNVTIAQGHCGTASPVVSTPPPPSPAPSPSPSPAPTPSPIPTPDNSPSLCQGNPSAPATCFDCKKDGQVNILDFSCFSKFYGKTI